MSKYVIGVDYGSDSARALIVNTATGEEIATSVKEYPQWKEGKYCNSSKNQYRQHPNDYIFTLEESIKEALQIAGIDIAKNIVGISFDTTGSTPVLIDKQGTPLSLLPDFSDNPNAMFVLWKDHTAIKEADEINELARNWEVDYTKYEGGIYSSEWVWAKMLHILRDDAEIREKAYSWVEHCDWLPALITGNTKPKEMIRSRCSAGHKAMWHTDWNGLPSEEFLTELDPLLKGFRDNLYTNTYTSDVKVGNLTTEWAKRLGLSENVAVGVGAFDCHMGAVGGGIKPKMLARAIGTSTCDIMIASREDMQNKLIKGICGQVDGSVMPNYIGLEAGQSGFGDIYAWFKNMLANPILNIINQSNSISEEQKEQLVQEISDNLLKELSEKASQIPIEESTILATDWMNGRRTPDASQLVKGTISGLTLGSTAPKIFKALVEATAYGSKAIVDRFTEEKIVIEEIIALGGVAKKSPFVMQVLADVLNIPIKVAKIELTCAYGACMFASVVAGIHSTIEDAQKVMEQGFDTIYYPNKKKTKHYQKLYSQYQILGSFTENKL